MTGERPRLLDLFCGAGGAGVGYDRAGFDVTGVDIRPQPHYPFTFWEARPDGRRLWTRADGSEQRAASSIEEARTAMGMDWGDWDGVREAIPPAYTEWIGRQLLLAVKVVA